MVPKWSPRGAQSHPFDDSRVDCFFIWGPFGLLWRPLGARVAKMTPRASKWSPKAPKSEVWGTPGASKKSTWCCFLCLFPLLFLSFFLFLFLFLLLPLSLSVLDLVLVLVRHGGGVARRALGYIYICIRRLLANCTDDP